jgi:sugar phosphate isomerase/epimerase
MPSFQYCLNTSTIKPAPLLEKITIAGAVGYSAIELWHEDIDAFLAGGGTLAEIKSALHDNNLTLPTTIYLKGWFEATDADRASVFDECKRRMHQAAELGALHVIAGPPPGQADHVLGAKNYREILEIGKQIGVKPALEYLGFVDEFNSIEKALDVLARADHPEGSIVHDPFHIFRGGGSFESVGRLDPRQIAIFHFNDAPATPPREEQHDKDRVLPGDGHLDLKHLIGLLKKVGYDRWLSLELFSEDLWKQDLREVAHVGLEKMKAVAEG